MVDPLSKGRTSPTEGGQAALHRVGLPAAPTDDPAWILVEEGFTLAREHELESLFAIGNGYVGSRGSLAEGSALSAPATFVAGVFDSEPGSVPELAPMADWSRLCATIDGRALRLDRGDNLEHRRTLDMRQGILWREWRHQDEAGGITRLRALRLASLADRHLLLQCVTITPENYSGRLSIDAAVIGPVAQVTEQRRDGGHGGLEPDRESLGPVGALSRTDRRPTEPPGQARRDISARPDRRIAHL